MRLESMADARAVTVTLYHDRQHPSTLYVPLGAAPAADEPAAPPSSFQHAVAGGRFGEEPAFINGVKR